MSTVTDRAPRNLRRAAPKRLPARRPTRNRVVRAQAPDEVVTRRLRSPLWRARHSLWLGIPAIGLPWLSFLYLGLTARRPAWVLAAVTYFAAAGGSLALFATESWTLNLLGLLLAFATWGTGLVHSVVSNSAWLRFKAALTGEPVLEPAPAAPPVEAPAADPVTAMQRELRTVVQTVNRAGGRLPDGAVPTVREIEDVLVPLLAHVAKRGADVEELHNLEAIVTEYLPGALEHYLDLPEQYALTHRGPSGTTPAQELVSQLGLLLDGTRQLQQAVYDHDAQRLATQGRFLDAKFRRSDLDL